MGPKPTYNATPIPQDMGDSHTASDRAVIIGQARAVSYVLTVDWVQAVRRQQQLLNECDNGVVRVCLVKDERGLVRVLPD
jgi:hypothetical protein